LRDDGIIFGGQRECLRRHPLAEFEAGAAIVRLKLHQQCRIIGRIGDDRDMGVVLGGRAHHRRSADVDILDDRVAVGAAHHRAQKGIEVHHDQVDRRNPMLFHGRDMVGIVANPQQPAVDLRVKRLDAPVHHFGKAGQVGDVANLGTALAQLRRCPASRDDFDAVVREPLRKLVEAALVRKGNQRALDRDQVSH